jgi:ribonuclease HI
LGVEQRAHSAHQTALDTIYIHADESCLGNQNQNRSSPGGAGGLVEIWRDGEWERRDYWISEPDTTNNRMALRSAIEAIDGLSRRCRVVFTSDSQYLVKGINEWRHGWKRANWKRKTGAIKNLELWQDVDEAVDDHDFTARWVRGHDGHPENEYVDFLATRAAADQTQSGGLIDSGFSDWLDDQREKGRFLDYMEFQEPNDRFE